MWRGIGALSVLAGIAGILRSWAKIQKVNQARVEEYIQFIHRSIYIMESEKLRVIEYFINYHAADDRFLGRILNEIARRLQSIKPNGHWMKCYLNVFYKQDVDFSEEIERKISVYCGGNWLN